MKKSIYLVFGAALLAIILTLSLLSCAKQEQVAPEKTEKESYKLEEVKPSDQMKMEQPAAEKKAEGGGTTSTTVEGPKEISTSQDIATETLKISKKIVKTGSLTIEVTNVDESLKELNKVLEKYNCDIGNRNVVGSGKYKGMSAVVTARVAPEEFENLVAEVKTLGKLKQENSSAEDVTKKHVDLMAQLKNAQALRERYLKMLEKAVTVNEMITIENELFRVSEKIETIQAELDSLIDLESRSTLTVTLQEPVSVLEPFAGFGQAMENTFRWVIKIFIFGLSFLILVIPFAIFFIVIFLIVKLIIKIVRAFSRPKVKLEGKKG